MSAPAVRQALETALAANAGGVAIAYENVPYEPVPGTPYQAAYVLAAEPENIEIGSAYTERGLFQINLFYPLNTGPGAAETRAKAIRDAFPRGATFTADGVTVHIERTPEIGPGRIEEDRYFKPVRIRFYSHIR
jgi:hypothetical protein